MGNEKNFYYKRNECEHHNYNKHNTNPRYKNFNQTHFTAGDPEQFSRLTRDDRVNCLNTVDIPESKFWTKPISFWNGYHNINSETYKNTFNYIFYKFKKGVFIRIRNNRLETFLPFSNAAFTNEWSNRVKIDKQFKTIDNLLRYTQEKEGRRFNPKRVNRNMSMWYANNCLVRYEFPITEGDSGTVQIKDMFDTLCKTRKVQDMEFFVNRRDFPIITHNKTEAYDHIFGKNTHLVSHNYKKYSPILSMVTREDYADIAIPTWEDWARVSSIQDGKFFPKACKDFRDKFILNWDKKKSIAVFRGGSTGCGINSSNNMRIKVGEISSTYPKYKGKLILDAGITSWNMRPRILTTKDGKTIMTTIKNPNDNHKVGFLSPVQQSEYRYIINIDGHTSAYRLSYEMGMGSCILLVDSKYKMWFRDYLVPYQHYVPVKKDLSDLVEKIEWCIDHDDECKQIAQNTLEFYKQYLNKDGVLDYLEGLLHKLNDYTGQYLNILDPLYYSLEIEKRFLEVVHPISNYKLRNGVNRVLDIPVNYSILEGISRTIQRNDYDIVLEKRLFSNNKVDVFVHDFLNKKELFSIKVLKNKEYANEFAHEAFVGMSSINKIYRKCPVFMYTFLYRDNKLFTELINGIQMGNWIESERFSVDKYIDILTEISNALTIAQEHCRFVHYDLFPWNIIIEKNDRPRIIDYGKSSIIYKNRYHYLIKPYKTNNIIDVISLLVTSLHLITTKRTLTTNESEKIINIANFLSGKYAPRFTSIQDIRQFTYIAKKYNNLLTSNKGHLSELSSRDFVIWLKRDTEYIIYETGNPRFVSDYILAKTDDERYMSFLEVFYRFNTSTLPQPINLLSLCYVFQELVNSLYWVYSLMMKDEKISELWENASKLLYRVYVENIREFKPSEYLQDPLPRLPDDLYSNGVFADNTELLRLRETYPELMRKYTIDFVEVKDIVSQVMNGDVMSSPNKDYYRFHLSKLQNVKYMDSIAFVGSFNIGLQSIARNLEIIEKKHCDPNIRDEYLRILA